VQSSLGHSSIKTTEIYSRKRFSFERISPGPNALEIINKSNETTSVL
jgi:hypothetical protein